MSDTRWCKNCNGYGNHSTAWCHGPIHQPQPEPVVSDEMIVAFQQAHYDAYGGCDPECPFFSAEDVAHSLAAALRAQAGDA